MLLLSLAVLIINVLLAPMGPMQPATGSYINLPFLSGFQDGYNTMDLLATLLFGATVINAIKLKGITVEPSADKNLCLLRFDRSIFPSSLFM